MAAKFTFFLSVLSMVFLSQKSAASFENFQVLLPRPWLNEQLTKSLNGKVDFSKDLPQSGTISLAGLPIAYQGVRLINGSHNRWQVTSQPGQLAVHSTAPVEFYIAIDQLAADGFIERRLGNQVFRVRVQFSCKNIQLHAKALQLKMSTPYQWQASEKKLMTSEKPTLFISEERSVQMNTADCQGLAGLATWAEQELNRLWTVDPWVWQGLPQQLRVFLNSSIENLNHFLLPHFFESMEGWILGTEQQPEQVDWEKTPLPVISLSQEEISGKVREKVLEQQFKNFSLNSLSSFQQLLGSRFLQFFVWPDLFNFSKKSPFLANSNLQNWSFKKASGTHFLARAQIGLSVLCFRDKKWQEYLSGKVAVQSRIYPTLRGGTMLVQLANEVQILEDPTFTRTYLSRYPNPGWLNTGMLSSGIQQALDIKAFQVKIPPVKLPDGQSLTAQQLQLNPLSERVHIVFSD